MTKHAKKSSHLQAVDRTKTATVEIPLPLLGAFAGFIDLCIRAGQQVWTRDGARPGGAVWTAVETRSRTPGWPRGDDAERGHPGRASGAMTRPRVRSQAGQELELPSFIFAANRDPLDARALDAVACGISTRKYARSLEALPDDIEERSTSKSAVSRRYIAMTAKQLTHWLTTPLGDRHFPIVMIDGIILGDHTVVIALGIDAEGKKQSGKVTPRTATWPKRCCATSSTAGWIQTGRGCS